MKRKLFPAVIILVVILSSCKQEDTIVNYSFVKPSYEELEKLLTIERIDYNSLIIKNSENAYMEEKYITRIDVGPGLNLPAQFQPNDTMLISYTFENDKYLIEFASLQKIDDKSLRTANYTCRFFFIDSSFSDIFLAYDTYKYPYSSCEIFMTADEVLTELYIYFQDIDLNENVLFFHPTGSLGLYEYNFSNRQTKELVAYGSGNCIAHDSIYVFWDLAHYMIKRYNLSLDSTDFEFDLSQLSHEGIAGLSCWQGKLYALFFSSTGKFVAKLDYDGNLLSTFPYPDKVYYLTIDKGIAYSINYEDTVLSLFDLKSESIIGTKLLPTIDWEGIRIYKSNFYYVDFSKRIIGVIPLSDLK